jgi:hypothetical protein
MTDVTPEPAPPRAGACAARAPARQRAAHPTRANAQPPALEQTVAREAAGVLAWSTRALAAHAASTTPSASRGSRERSAGRHLRRDAARRRRAHQVGRPRLRHAARPRERRRNPLRGHACAGSQALAVARGRRINRRHVAPSVRLDPRLASLAASRRPALRVPGRDLHDDDRESVGVAGHHLDEAPGLALRLLSITTSAAASRRHSWWTSRT